jgi:hypothetical protein
MKNVDHVLNSIKGHLPQHAAPVVSELLHVLQIADEKVQKYAARGTMLSMVKAMSESVRRGLQGARHAIDCSRRPA